MKHTTDIAVIGAGPAGLFFVFEAGMLKMRCHVIDSLEMIGGQCSALYPEKPIYDIPAHPQITAQSLIDSLATQITPFHPTYHLNQRVEKVSYTQEYFTIETSRKNIIEAKAIVIAAGCGAFGPNRPPLTNLEDYEGKSVFYHVVQQEKFRHKRIVIAGGGDSAVDWAIALHSIAEKIYVVHRRAKFRCAPESSHRLEMLAKEGLIELVIPYQLDELKGQNGILEAVQVRDLDNHIRLLEADILLPFFGLAMELGPIADWGLNLHKHHIMVNPSTMETNIAGIYGIGDIITYPGKLKLILNGFAEAAMAAYAIHPRLYPDQPLHFEYSTTKGVTSNASSLPNPS